MSTTRPIARRATTTQACPVCASGTKGCSVTDDGLLLCRGDPADPSAWSCLTRQPDDAGFRGYRLAEDDRHRRNGQHRAEPRAIIGSPRDWGAEARVYAEALSPDLRQQLASELRLPAEAFAALPLLDWCDSRGALTFPECDGTGRLIGIALRWPGGRKEMVKGSQRGLIVPAGWKERPGPVYVVEGGSDVLALAVVGLAALGRFSNLGGGDQLAELLRDLPADRPIIVLAENDQKPSGEWPGKAGAERVAEVLRTQLGRPVRIVYPPDDLKDARAWVQDLLAGQAEAEDLPGIGQAIMRHCEKAAAQAERGEPPLPPLPPSPSVNGNGHAKDPLGPATQITR